MKLKKLKIKSYRSCINTNLDIQRGLTALIGVNGTGKSNILNAVLLLKKISSTSRHSYYGEYKEKDLLVNKSSLELEIEYKSKPIFIKNRISYNTDEENNDDLVNCETTWDFSKLLTDIKTPISIPSKMFRFGHFFMDENITHLPGNITSFGGQRINSDEFQNIKLIYPHVETILKELNKISYYGASQFSDPSQCPNFIEIEDGKLIRKYRSNDKHEKFITDLYRTSKEKGNKFELYINTSETCNQLVLKKFDKHNFQTLK
jgi:predicted ATP-dependent endonuclease of OLD family